MSKITYGLAYKFNKDTPADNPFAEQELTEMSKESQEYWFGSGTSSGLYGNRIRRMGWEIPIIGLRVFVVKSVHGHIQEMLSPNKTLIREKLKGSGFGKIAYIQEVYGE